MVKLFRIHPAGGEPDTILFRRLKNTNFGNYRSTENILFG